MTDIDTEELRRLTREATPGPWTFGLRNDPDAPASVYRWQHSTATPTGGRSGVAEAIAMSPRYGLERFKTDAALIVAMRNALPGIIAALDAKDREIKRLREQADDPETMLRAWEKAGRVMEQVHKTAYGEHTEWRIEPDEEGAT